MDLLGATIRFNINLSLEGGLERTWTYRIPTGRVNPTQPVDDATTFFNLVAILGIVLVDVKGQEGGDSRDASRDKRSL